MSETWLAGRYVLKQRLTSDSFTHVWLAEDRLFQCLVAIKGIPLSAPEPLKEALLQEFSTLWRLKHPRLPRALSLHTAASFHPPSPSASETIPERLTFFTQRWLSGPSLHDLRGRLPHHALRAALEETLELLAFLHAHGLTRLDIKSPHLIRESVGWCLIDLDQARPYLPLADEVLHGTLAYLAPEMRGGGAGSPQADLYSLGATFYEAYVGMPPGGARQEGHDRRLAELMRDDLPLANMLEQLLATMPHERPGSAEDALALLAPSRVRNWRHRCALPVQDSQEPRADSDLNIIERHFDLASSSDGGGIIVSGPPGSGRTHLLEALTARWQRAGRAAMLMRSATLPKTLWSGTALMMGHLESLLLAKGQGLSAPLLPLTDQPSTEARAAQETWMLGRFMSASHRVFKQTGILTPLLIDDASQLDAASRSLLERVAPLLSGSGLFLCVVVDEEGILKGPDAGIRLSMKALERLELGSWSIEDIRTHVEAVLPGRNVLSREVFAQLQAATGGWPGPVREALTQLWREPDVSLQMWHPLAAGEQTRMLEPLLSTESWTQVRLAALFPGPFSSSAWAAVCEAPPDDLQIHELAAVGILEQVGALQEANSQWRFRSEPLRRAIEACLPIDARASGHRRILAYLQDQALENNIPARQLAYHFQRADQPEGARGALQNALNEALAAGALEEAVGHVYALLELVPPGARSVAGLHARLAELLHGLCRYQEAEKMWQTCLGQPSGQPNDRRASWLAGLGKARVYLGRLREAVEPLETAVQLHTEAGGDARERVPWLQLLAWIQHPLGTLGRAESFLRQARLAEIPETSPLWLEQLYLEAMTAHAMKRPVETLLEPLEAAVHLARKRKNERSEIKLLNLRAAVYRDHGDPERALIDLEAIVHRAHASYALEHEAGALNNQGEVLRSMKRLAPAVNAFSLAAEAYARLNNWRAAIATRLEMVRVLHQLRRSDSARRELERTQSQIISIDDPELQRTFEEVEALLSSSGSGDSALNGQSRERLLNHASTLLGLVQHLLYDAQDERTLAEGLADLAGQLVGGRGILFLIEDGQPVAIRSAASRNALVIDISESILRQVIRSQHPYLNADVLEQMEAGRLASLRQSAVRSVHCRPMIRDGQCIGVLYVDHPEPEGVTGDAATATLCQVTALAERLLDALVRRRQVKPFQVSGPLAELSDSPAMQTLAERLVLLVRRDKLPSVVLTGDTGVGKSWLAKQLHRARGGRDDSFIEVNCAAVPREIFEAEFFGTTDYARSGRVITGYFDRARGGTLFLDEIGCLALDLQAKLLSVLQNRAFMVMGSKEQRRLECDLIFGTNADLPRMVEQGTFRQDLLHRIGHAWYRVPSLKERGEEGILALTRRFIARFLRVGSNESLRLETWFTPCAIRWIVDYHWPGNVRQLEALFCANPDIGHLLEARERILPADLETALRQMVSLTPALQNSELDLGRVGLARKLTMKQVRIKLAEVKQAYVRRAVLVNGGNKSKTARELGISRSNLDSLLEGSQLEMETIDSDPDESRRGT